MPRLSMTPWFIATEPFTPDDGCRWTDYVHHESASRALSARGMVYLVINTGTARSDILRFVHFPVSISKPASNSKTI